MNESIYDLALLAAAVVIIAMFAVLGAFSDLPIEVVTAGLGVGAGILGARSGRARVGS